MTTPYSRTHAGTVLCALSVMIAACGSSETPAATTSSNPSTSSGASSEVGATADGGASENSASGTATTESPTGTPSASGATTTTTTTTNSATSATASPAMPDIPMRVQSQPGSTGWFDNIDAERRADGSLYFHDQPIGRLEGGRILSMSGQLIPLTGRISIGTRAGREHMEIQADGSITMDAGRLTIDAQGDVSLARHGGAARPVHVHVTGYRPDALGLADILVVYGILKADLASR